MDAQTQLITVTEKNEPLLLESGAELPQVTLAYETYGKLDAEGRNAILICHALTGDAHAAGNAVYSPQLLEDIPMFRSMKSGQPGWWDGVIGPGRIFDTDKYFVICSNILGSCYGSSGPLSINPDTKQKFGPDFPVVTVRDIVNAQHLLLKKLGVNELISISGGSLGGMQALEWSIMYPRMVRSIIPIATAAQHSAWGIGLNHLARQAVCNDPDWMDGNYRKQPFNGLSLARKIGMISYRTDISFQERFGRERQQNNGQFWDEKNLFQVDSYLNYQGEKLVKRFDANSFMRITRTIDLHDVGRERGSVAAALGSIKAKALCIGIDTDVLYPAHEQQSIRQLIPNSKYGELKSRHGHDGFLIEFDQMKQLIGPFLKDVSGGMQFFAAGSAL